MKIKNASVGFLMVLLLVSGCQSSQQELLKTDKGQVEIRRMQTRAYDTTDREKTLRTVIATLQDLGFVVDKADATLGSVTATKLKGYNLIMTVTVRPRNEKQLLVRASAQFNIQAVSDPQPYQDFFTSFSKAIFLEAHQVD